MPPSHSFLLIAVPIALGLLILAFRNNVKAQLASILVGAMVDASAIVLLEVLPAGGVTHHGNTLQGYAIVVFGPFLMVFATVLALHSTKNVQAVAAPWLVAVAVPVSYWVGLVLSVLLAVNAGLVAP